MYRHTVQRPQSGIESLLALRPSANCAQFVFCSFHVKLLYLNQILKKSFCKGMPKRMRRRRLQKIGMYLSNGGHESTKYVGNTVQCQRFSTFAYPQISMIQF